MTLFLDTETTGLDRSDRLVRLAPSMTPAPWCSSR